MPVSAALIEAGVDLPERFFDLQGRPFYRNWRTGKGDLCFSGGYAVPAFVELDETAPDTRAALLRQLAIWAGDDGKAQAYCLYRSLARGTALTVTRDGPPESIHVFDVPPGPGALAAILTAIGKGEVTRG